MGRSSSRHQTIEPLIQTIAEQITTSGSDLYVVCIVMSCSSGDGLARNYLLFLIILLQYCAISTTSSQLLLIQDVKSTLRCWMEEGKWVRDYRRPALYRYPCLAENSVRYVARKLVGILK